jgi:hypothetical protein
MSVCVCRSLGCVGDLATSDRRSSTQVNDVSALASCQSLHKLNLGKTRVSDVSALESCQSLSELLGVEGMVGASDECPANESLRTGTSYSACGQAVHHALFNSSRIFFLINHVLDLRCMLLVCLWLTDGLGE